jgi:NarL family two-component system response regulator LiaR
MATDNQQPLDSGNSVILAHPHTLLREGIAHILREGGFDICGQTDNLRNLHELAAQHKPSIVILDWEISETQVDAVKGLNRNFPNISIVVLSRPHTSGEFLDALAAGAVGYLSVNLSPKDFIQSLYMLAKGRLVVAKEQMVGEEVDLTLGKSRALHEELSERETEVLSLVGRGRTNREIAEELIISEHTVKVHLRTILNKLVLRNRQQAASYATKIGLVKETEPGENQT